jgi:hypothetical protein
MKVMMGAATFGTGGLISIIVRYTVFIEALYIVTRVLRVIRVVRVSILGIYMKTVTHRSL